MKFQSKKRNSNSVSTGSMADIAFLLLIFFFVSTNIFNEKGIQMKLPKYHPVSVEKPKHFDHVVDLIINGEGQMMYEKRYIASEKYEKILFNDLKRFLDQDYKLHSRISLQYDRSTSYEKYFKILENTKRVINKIKDEYCNMKFGHDLEECDGLELKIMSENIDLDIWEMPLMDFARVE